MSTLVKDVINIEKEAESIVSLAQEEAKRMEKHYEDQVADYRKKVMEETDRKIARFRKDAEEKHNTRMAEAEGELAAALGVFDRIPDDSLQEQAERIVERLVNH